MTTDLPVLDQEGASPDAIGNLTNRADRSFDIWVLDASVTAI